MAKSETIETHFEIPVSILRDTVVIKRDGSMCSIDLTKIPETFFADFVVEGVAEYIRDSSSAALANAYDIANPDHKLEGKKLVAARAVWLDETTVDAVAKESGILMSGARDRLYAGERRISKGSTVDPMDDWRIKVLRAKMRVADGAAMKTEHDAIDSGDQKARREYLLGIAAKNEWVDVDAKTMRDDAVATAVKLAASKITIKL